MPKDRRPTMPAGHLLRKHRTIHILAAQLLHKHRRADVSLTQQQPYDNLMKSLFADNEQQAINAFLPGAKYLETLNIEVLRTPMRVDYAYKIFYKHLDHVLHVEFESGSNPHMGARLHNYHAHLHSTHNVPVISIIIYPFPTTMATSPFREMSGDEEIVTFHFHTIALWEEEASKYLHEHRVNLYPLLPAMAHVDQTQLLQAIEEMVQYYKDDETKLGEQLRWLGVLLRRAEALPLEDKERVQEELNMFNRLLEEDPYLQQKIATGVAKGIAEKLPKEIDKEVAKREAEHAKREAEHAKREAEYAKQEAEREARYKAEMEALKRDIEARVAKIQAEAQAKEAKMQAEAQAKEAEAQAARASLENTALHIVEGRFPDILPLAQEKLPRVKTAEGLEIFITQLALAPNEETARWLLKAL